MPLELIVVICLYLAVYFIRISNRKQLEKTKNINVFKQFKYSNIVAIIYFVFLIYCLMTTNFIIPIASFAIIQLSELYLRLNTKKGTI